MTKHENGTVTYSVKNNTGVIEFYHPKGNSLPGTLLRQLASTIHVAGKDEEARVVLLKSSGEGAFCAGASFDELMAINHLDEGKEFFMGFALVINAMRTCPKIIVSRVHGKTVGGGIGLVAASDFCIALNSASIKLSELSLGIGPFVVGPAVGRKLGVSAFSTLALDAKSWFTAEWALTYGLYNKLAGSVEELDAEVSRITADLAASNPEALRNMKDIFWQATGHWGATLEQRAEISGKLVLSDYTKETIDKFKAAK
ncbi:MAG: enoyl-CoA hydratase/isomerase family protein [Balneolaceae bacterium]|nr:MAG: enoyl-CoA hydratase/isomerase family protein [Balneolaceae bacterium]